jgi:hypothetical protein
MGILEDAIVFLTPETIRRVIGELPRTATLQRMVTLFLAFRKLSPVEPSGSG